MCARSISAEGDFRRFRHRWEMPMIWLSALITIFAFLGALFILLVDVQTVLVPALGEEDAAALVDTASLLILLPLAPLLFYAYRFYMAAGARANAILIGPEQFPDLHALYRDLARRLDMPVPPKLYLTNGNGVVNAYALECNRRHRYVVLHSEIALLLPQAPDVVEFVLAHELAHHKLRHVSLWRLVIGIIPNILLIGTTTTRAQEYSADRVALAICPDHAAAVRLLAVGPWMANGVNPEAWAAQCEAEHREWLIRLTNATSSHAVMVKRFKALRDIERDGFGRQGEMF